MAGVELPHIIGLIYSQSKTHDEGVEDLHAGLLELPIELCRERTETRQGIFRKPNIVLHVILFAADFVCFLGLIK